MNRFFPYYGAKHAYIRHYPAPRHGHIVEPFAGSAAYAHAHGAQNEVTLIEKNPRIAAIWEWLISVSADELMSLPGIDTIEHIDQSGLTDGPAREFLRQWMATAQPIGQNARSSMATAQMQMNKWWFSERCRDDFCTSLQQIRHWRVRCGSYDSAPDTDACWFVDPPYIDGGRRYAAGCKNASIDFGALAQWCVSRRGDVIVCEGDGAAWLPFEPLVANMDRTMLSTGFGKRQRTELVYYQRDGQQVPAWNVKSYASQNQQVLF